MERCKIGGESLRNRGVSNEDMISQLPEALLLQILSLLETKHAVATSVLSKRWRSLWKVMPSLKFICPNGVLDTFSAYVCKILLSHQAPVLQRLHLEIDCDEGSGLDIGILIGVAFGLHVREFVLDVECKNGSFRFPRSMYNCGTLETLKLVNFISIDVPFPVCLKSLKTLHLDGMDYKDDGSMVNLLSGCSRLENLEVVTYSQPQSDVKTFTIDVPSLQRLSICLSCGAGEIYVIKAPSLKYLKIEGFIKFESLQIGNTPELEEAHIDITLYEYIMRSLTSAIRLFLISPESITYPTGSIFYRLVYLELLTFEPEWFNAIMLMLNGSPKLQVLKLTGPCISKADGVVYKKWLQPKNVPECLSLHLQTLVWEFHKVQMEEEKEVVKYILRNASHLKNATFSFSMLEFDLENRSEVLEELENVDKASNYVQMKLRWRDFGCKW